MIAGASKAELTAITEYAASLGLLFQITDDLLDVTATAEDLGKTPGKDARAQKATFPALYGIEATRAQLMTVHTAARDALESVETETALLQSIVDFILQRQG